MKIKIISIFLLAVMCLSLYSCGSKSSDTDAYFDSEIKLSPFPSSPTPLLYKITDDDGDVCWLFGSIHVGTEDMYPLPEYVTSAFDSSDALAVEFDIIKYETDTSAQMKSLSKLVYPNGKIESVIGTETYTEAVEILTDCGIYSSVLDMYMPVFWANIIDSIIYEEMGIDFSLGIDRHMINLAYDADKPVYDIESAALQYEALSSFSWELQAAELKSAMARYNNKDNVQSELAYLVEIWSVGNVSILEEYMFSAIKSGTEEDRALSEEYNKIMLTDRNVHMASYIEDALDSGEEVFVCVGAAHLVGNDGIARILKDAGYTVKAMR